MLNILAKKRFWLLDQKCGRRQVFVGRYLLIQKRIALRYSNIYQVAPPATHAHRQ